MDRRSLPLARAIVSGVLLSLIAALAGCGNNQALYEEAKTEAESSIAIELEITAAQTTDLLTQRAAMAEITDEDIIAVFLNDSRSYEAGLPNIVGTRALFDMVENTDGSVTFSVFLRANSYRAAGLSSTNLSRHTCGSLTGQFAKGMLSVADRDCPPEVAAAAAEGSVLLSMTENAAKFGVNVGTVP